MDAQAIAALTPMQRKAFILLMLEHAAAALEVPDRRRYERYKRAPRFDAILARQWRALVGQPAAQLDSSAASNPSVAHLFPEGSTQRRFADYLDFHALPEDGTVTDDEMLLKLQVAETEQAAAWVFDVATIAFSVLESEDPRPYSVRDTVNSFEQLYAERGASGAVAAHVDACLAFARHYAGTLDGAAAACAQARARASAVFAASAVD